MFVPFVRHTFLMVFIIGCCCSAVIADEGAPRIISTPVTTGVVGVAYSYDVQTTGLPAPIFLLTSAPSGMTIDSTSGLIQWTPRDPGLFHVSVYALNLYGSFIQNYSITVTPAPESPQITSTPITTMLIDEAYFYDVNAKGYPSPIHLLNQSPEGMTIEAASGQINWDPEETGSFDISIIVENGLGADTQRFILNVYEFPVITSDPDTTATVNNLYQYDVEATGSPSPAYTLTQFPSGMTIDNASGLIEWIPEYEHGDIGQVDITIQVGNPAGVVIQEYVLFVDPVYNSPSIISQPVTSGTVGQLYTYDVDAIGSPAPTFSLAVLPGGMTIDSLTGVIQWTPATDGDFDVSVQSNNVAGSIVQNFIITVEKADAVPSIESTPILEAISGELYTYQVIATGYPEPLFALIASPSGMTIDSISGMIQWTPTVGGDFAVTVAAANKWGTDLQEFTIHSQSPESPFITSIPVTSIGAGQTYAYDVEATGFPIPTYSLDVFPAGMTIDNITGLIHWKPLVPTEYEMTIRATNSVGSFSQSFVIDVVEAFQAPAIITTPTSAVEVGVTYYYDAEASGYPIPTFSLLDAPTGMTVEPSTGMVEWTPTEQGSWSVELQAINSVGSAIQNFMVATVCCGTYRSGFTGNTNCDTEGLCDLADITKLIDNVYISKAELCCPENGNTNGDVGGLINLADITRLIDHVYITKEPTTTCL